MVPISSSDGGISGKIILMGDPMFMDQQDPIFTDLATNESLFLSNSSDFCNRVQNGVATLDPLWPWPMDSRLVQALEMMNRTSWTLTELV